MMNGKHGGISIFLAVTFLSLIVFVMSIVEVTRYQILRAQAERMVISATQSVLAGYDTALKNQYGIFARDPAYGDVAFVMPESYDTGTMEEDFGYYVRGNADQTVDSLHMSLVDKYVFDHPSRHDTNLAPFEVTKVGLKTTKHLVETREGGLNYVKEDMTRYMELRLPLVGFGKILETFGAAEKLGKTTELVADKNTQVEKAAAIEALFEDLYYHLDGAKPDGEGRRIEVAQTHYVNRLDSGKVPMTLPYNKAIVDGPIPALEEPLKALDNIRHNQESWSAVIPGLKNALTEYEAVEAQITKEQEVVQNLEGDINQKEATIALKEGTIATKASAIRVLSIAKKVTGNQIQNLEAQISDLQRAVESLEAHIQSLETQVEHHQKEIERLEKTKKAQAQKLTHKMAIINATDRVLKNDLPIITALTIGEDSYRHHNEEATTIIEDIQTAAKALGASVDGVIEDAWDNRDSYISATADQTVTELEALKDNYGLGDGKGTGKARQHQNNIGEIHKAIRHNEAVLKAASQSVAFIGEDYVGFLVTALKDEGLQKSDMIRLYQITGDAPLYDGYLARYNWTTHRDLSMIPRALSEIKGAVESYQLAPSLDYSGFDGGTLDPERAKDKEDFAALKAYMEKFKTMDFLPNLTPDKSILLPEGSFSEAFEVLETIEKSPTMAAMTGIDEGDYQGGNSPNDDEVFMDSGKALATEVSALENAKTLLLINEYAIGMFGAYPDQKDTSLETLAGYKKSARPYPTELEYIYTGIRDSKGAVQEVSLKIFGVRTAFNIVHLATSGAKRAIIMKVAAAIAGPIGFGVLTAVMALLITLVWSVVESFVDVQKLLEGETVPLMKTSATWYTSLRGMANLAAETATDLSTQAATGLIDAGAKDVKDKMARIENSLNSHAKKVVGEAMDRYIDRADSLIYGAVDAFEHIYHEALDEAVLAYRENGRKLAPEDYITESGPQYKVLADAMDALYKKLDTTVDAGYVEMMAIKDDIIGTYKDQYDTAKEGLKNRVMATVEGTVTETFDALAREMDDKTEAAKEGATQAILKKLEGATKSLKDKAGEAALEVPEKRRKLDVDMLIPGVDYQMYLRLFMLAESDELDDRVVRMLDLMDYNLAVERYGQKGAEKRNLINHAVEVTGFAEMRTPYLFLDLPVQGMKQFLADDFYTLRAKAVNGYE